MNHEPRMPPTDDQTPLADAVIRAAVEDAIRQTSWRDDSPLPSVGSTPPVAQPGIPPMDPRITQIGRLCLYMGCATVPPGLVASLFMMSTGYADPTVIGWCAVGIASLAVPIGAVVCLVKRVVSVAPPPDVHNHYEGTVYQDQRNIHSRTSGVWASSNNEQ